MLLLKCDSLLTTENGPESPNVLKSIHVLKNFSNLFCVFSVPSPFALRSPPAPSVPLSAPIPAAIPPQPRPDAPAPEPFSGSVSRSLRTRTQSACEPASSLYLVNSASSAVRLGRNSVRTRRHSFHQENLSLIAQRMASIGDALDHEYLSRNSRQNSESMVSPYLLSF